jgi:alpha-glucosidase
MKKAIVFVMVLMLSSVSGAVPKVFSLLSPDKKLEVKISVSDILTFSIIKKGVEIIAPSSISMTINENNVIGKNSTVIDSKNNSVKRVIPRVVKQKSREVVENYNELRILFKEKFALNFRVFNEGVAYRFETEFPGEIKINHEECTFNFADDYSIYFPEEESFMSHNERLYPYLSLKEIKDTRFCSTPAVVDTKEGTLIGITESDLFDYPGLWLKGTSANSLKGMFPQFVLEEKAKNDRDVEPIKRADYLAITKGTRTFPWRIFGITNNDGDLITNELVFLLSQENKLNDVSWIKPGKVAWDWWNANNIYGVDFRAGINTETYKYYIDFASKYGIEYIILDEGWYKLGDILSTSPEMDIPELMKYAKEKNVGIILWVIWKTLENQLIPALDQFEKWGAAGIKVDFMQRDDQTVVNYYWKVAEEAAKRKLLVDYHGAHKPAGLFRAYPNVITNEGVKGLENNKWSSDVTPEHCVTIPFTRMFAGPIDFTPGAMNNVQVSSFKDMFSQPVSMGTRAQQLAMYVIYESPLQMLCDLPTNYYKESECMEFLSKVPAVWDETKILDAKIADYILVARKNGEEWYIGAMTDNTQRKLTVDFSFLDEGKHKAHIWQDGINADRNGNDYKKITIEVSNKSKHEIKLAPGGGWAAIITK